MTSDTNPAAALRSAMRDLLSMFTETLGDQAGAAALKTAVERALSEVTGAARAKPSKPRSKPAAKSAAKPAAKPTTPKPGPAAKRAKKKKRKKKATSGPPSPGRLRQMEAMKEYWRRKRAEAEEAKEPADATA